MFVLNITRIQSLHVDYITANRSVYIISVSSPFSDRNLFDDVVSCAVGKLCPPPPPPYADSVTDAL